MPKPDPKEFRDDVVCRAENREPEVTIQQIAADFDVHPMTLHNWVQRARSASGDVGSSEVVSSSAEAAVLRKLGRRRR